MSGFGAYGGGRTRHGHEVLVNIYDLSPANESILNPIGFGIHHSGLEINGEEYSFASGAGIFTDTPKQAGGAKYSHSLRMGTFEGSAADIRAAISDLRDSFGPNSYNVLAKNCNHFSDALCQRLLNVSVPGYVNRAAYFGSFFSCLVPDEVLGGAPVGDPNNGGSSGTAPGFSVMGGGERNSGSNKAFVGTGQSLGGGSSSAANASSDESEALLDRREKARQAALKRFEQNQN
ncbi:hypothetical protein TrVE_jg3585 [Triparma verrucosa]|uniref:PPPDE domain-containing protein n=1 Tax=Triparma verrucosa TaxID=1606542 RepID=A0A9W7C8B0_9STRA|nr:hypothetical protein TrVE_jg3585 [Triparma verrucosa]